MNLGQMMLVLGALAVLGRIVLNSNSTILQTQEVLNTSETDITAISLATSIIEEASGKLFDEVITDPGTDALTSTTQLSTTLGRDHAEKYRDTSSVFEDLDDFDDFNGLLIVYKSDKKEDAPKTPGSHWEFVVKDIRSIYYVRTKVEYADPKNLNAYSTTRTWHKKLIVTVTSPTSKDTLLFPSVMSYWN